MAKDFDEKKYFHTLLEKACKGTNVTAKDLLRELVNSGYKNIYSGDLSLEDLKMIVADLVDSKEISEMYSHKSGKKSATTETDEDLDDDDSDDDDSDEDDDDVIDDDD
jgi:hypothetical protein